jgi:hypothetical protein
MIRVQPLAPLVPLLEYSCVNTFLLYYAPDSQRLACLALGGGAVREPEPTFDFLLNSSQTALESYELSRLNKAANLRKELRRVVEDWIDSEVNARFARLLMDLQRGRPGEPESENPSALSASRTSPALRRLNAQIEDARRQLPAVDAPPAAAYTQRSSPPAPIPTVDAPLDASLSVPRSLALALARRLDQTPWLQQRSSREPREGESLPARRILQGSLPRPSAVRMNPSPPKLRHSVFVGALLRTHGRGDNSPSIRRAAKGCRGVAPTDPLRNAS